MSDRPFPVPASLQGGTHMPFPQSSAECAVGSQSKPSRVELALSKRVSGGVESTQCRAHADDESAHNKPRAHSAVEGPSGMVNYDPMPIDDLT